MILVQIIWYIILLFSTTTRGSSQTDYDYDYDHFDETRICYEEEVQCEPANSKIEFTQCFSKELRYNI